MLRFEFFLLRDIIFLLYVLSITDQPGHVETTLTFWPVVRAKTGCTVDQVGYQQVELLFALLLPRPRLQTRSNHLLVAASST